MPIFNETTLQFNKNSNSAEFYLAAIGKLLPDSDYVVARDYAQNDIIEYVVDGVGYIEVDGITSKVTAGDCYVLRRGSCHKYYSDSVNPYTKLWVNISGAMVDEWLNLYGITLTPYIKRFDMTKYYNTLRDLISKRDADYNTEIMLTIHALIFTLSRAQEIATIKTEGSSKGSGKLLLNVKKYIEKNATEIISLDVICQEFNVSSSHLIKLFKRQFGTTPYRYALNCKIEIARALLETSDLSIDMIAEKLNFFDRNHFKKLFAQTYNLTPSTYRKLAFKRNVVTR